LLIDFGHSISIYGLLNAYAHPVLVDVEEQQLFQGGPLATSM
jgi:hypothetical protein